jgi:hypothetical protein
MINAFKHWMILDGLILNLQKLPFCGPYVFPEDIAVLLRSWTGSAATDPTALAARRRVARHPDGLGHLAVPEAGEASGTFGRRPNIHWFWHQSRA